MKHEHDRIGGDEAVVSQPPHFSNVSGSHVTQRHAATDLDGPTSSDGGRVLYLADAWGPSWQEVDRWLLGGLGSHRVDAWRRRSPAFAKALRVLHRIAAAEEPMRNPPLLGLERAPEWLLEPPGRGDR